MINTHDPEMIKKIIPMLKRSSDEANDGCHVLVYYKAYKKKKSAKAIAEATPAKNQGIDLHTYCGPLAGWVEKTDTTDSFIFTILSLTRIGDNEFKYRTFNVDKGEVVDFYAFPDFPTTTKVNVFRAIEVPRSLLRRLWDRARRLLWS